MPPRSSKQARGHRVVARGLVVPRHLDLMNPALQALRELGGSASIAELVDKVVDIVKPSKAILEHPHGDGRNTELEYQLAWARTYLKKCGLVTNSAHGIWALTPMAAETPTIDAAEVVRLLRSGQLGKKSAEAGSQPLPAEQVGDEPDALASWRELLMDALLSVIV